MQGEQMAFRDICMGELNLQLNKQKQRGINTSDQGWPLSQLIIESPIIPTNQKTNDVLILLFP